jgi:hypothetical protein
VDKNGTRPCLKLYSFLATNPTRERERVAERGNATDRTERDETDENEKEIRLAQESIHSRTK